MLRVAARYRVENLPNILITEIYRKQSLTQRYRVRSAWEAFMAQWKALTIYSYPSWQGVYLLRGLAFIVKSVTLQFFLK